MTRLNLSRALCAATLCAATLCAVALAGCGDRPADPPPPPAPDAAPPPPAAPTVEARRARYEKRPTVTLPDALPAAWRRSVDALDGRLVEARHEVRSTAGREDWRAVHLRVRVFGLDDAVRAAVHGALTALELPDLPPLAAAPEDFWQGRSQAAGPVRWSVDIGRLVAPPGEPREQIVELRWRRAPSDPDDPRDCRKPVPVEAPPGTPGWLTRTTHKRTTRRRITAAVHHAPQARTVELRMLFRNGLAHDEHVRHLAEGAARAGFVRESGEGPRQRWRHPDGATFAFDPDTRGDLGLGCKLAGPVIAIRLVTPRP